MKIMNKVKSLISNKTKQEQNFKETDDNITYSKLIYNTPQYIIILVSFCSKDYINVISILDAIREDNTILHRIIYSTYTENFKDYENESFELETPINYLLIGGTIKEWVSLYNNIDDLNNDVLKLISEEIINNCSKSDFAELFNNGIFESYRGKDKNINYDKDAILEGEWRSYKPAEYTNINTILSRLPSSINGKDILKFIRIRYNDKEYDTDLKLEIHRLPKVDDEYFKNHALYPLYSKLIKSPTMDKLSMLIKPRCLQIDDDDGIPGDISDESLHEIFKEEYERFSAISDDSIHYKDIDEILDKSDIIEEGDDEDI